MRTTGLHGFIALALAALLLPGAADAKSHHKKKPKGKPFSYYLLVLSYAPDFCNQPQGDHDPRECGTGRRVGFVVHGLWPQGETDRGPQNCGGSPVSQAIVKDTLPYVPTESLIKHEWKAHGTCSGLSADDYFATLRKARDAVNLPDDLKQPTERVRIKRSELESKLNAANPSYPASAFRTACYHDAELKEIRICLSKDLTPRACGPSAGQCPADTITLLPVR